MGTNDCTISHLIKEDVDTIINQKELEEPNIILFNSILKKYTNFDPQHPSMWMDPACIKPVHRDTDYVQLIYTPNHWICCYYDTKKVFIYDSLNHGRGVICNELKICLENLFPYINLKAVQFPKVQQQPNKVDCGVYAIAFTISLLFGIKPNTVRYEHTLMRKHLHYIFQKFTIEHFPQDPGYEIKNVLPLPLALQRRYDALRMRKQRFFNKQSYPINKSKSDFVDSSDTNVSKVNSLDCNVNLPPLLSCNKLENVLSTNTMSPTHKVAVKSFSELRTNSREDVKTKLYTDNNNILQKIPRFSPNSYKPSSTLNTAMKRSRDGNEISLNQTSKLRIITSLPENDYKNATYKKKWQNNSSKIRIISNKNNEIPLHNNFDILKDDDIVEADKESIASAKVKNDQQTVDDINRLDVGNTSESYVIKKKSATVSEKCKIDSPITEHIIEQNDINVIGLQKTKIDYQDNKMTTFNETKKINFILNDVSSLQHTNHIHTHNEQDLQTESVPSLSDLSHISKLQNNLNSVNSQQQKYTWQGRKRLDLIKLCEVTDCSVPSPPAIKEELNSDEDELQPPLCVTLMSVQVDDGEEFHVSDTSNAEAQEKNASVLPNFEPTFEAFVKEEHPICSDSETEREKDQGKTASPLAKTDVTSEISLDPNTERFSCPECGKWFPTYRGIKRHLARHSGARPYGCDKCTATYTDSSTLRRHKRIVHPSPDSDSPDAKFECKSCNRQFMSQYLLTRHERTHTGEQPFTCEQCGMCFAQRAYLVSHVNSKHIGKQPFECPVCGKRFSYRSSLRHHLGAHEVLRAHKCETCGKSFVSFWKLKQHISALHNTDPEGPPRPHSCRFCNASYRYPAGLQIHIRSVHSGEKPFCCEECGATFSDGSYLSIHRRKHSDERPLSCSECDMTFKYKANLHRHKASKHNQKKVDIKAEAE